MYRSTFTPRSSVRDLASEPAFEGEEGLREGSPTRFKEEEPGERSRSLIAR